MHIERVEQICLPFLRQAANPLTPISALLDCCREKGVGPELTRETLLEFLRAHGEVLVLEGPEDHEAVNAASLAEAGILMEPRAILKSRVPSRRELFEALQMQADQARATLLDALDGARRHGDTEATEQIAAILERTEQLRGKLEDFK